MKKAIPFGKYDLLERINVGGMAEVFRAKAYGVEGFERLVAVKRILPNIAEDQEFATMFKDEAKIAVQLNHANIAQIYELGVVDSALFIALEHVHGRDLRAMFERCRSLGGPMPVAQACFIIMKLCEGLDYAHNKRDAQGRDMNLVHRDVSPQNVLVSFEGEIKIIDFGIAKAANKVGKTQAGILKGKFGYMSPEQVRGLPIDRRSDIFATGIVLYELLTNERLFVGETDFSTLEKVRNVEILPPSTYNRKIPDELERIVLKALARDMDDRYANAIDLHDELQAFVYTAGEFYSRKDLAAWMKKTFAKEIEEETAKIESYRQIAPSRTDGESASPPVEKPRGQQPSFARTTQEGRALKVPQAIRKTISMPAAVPPPTPAAAPPRPAANGRAGGRPSREMQVAAVASQPPTPSAPLLAEAEPTTVEPPIPIAAPRVSRQAAAPAPSELEWDDEELETQIYDTGAPPPVTDEEQPKPQSKPQPAAPSMSSSGSRRKPADQFVTAPTVPASDPVGVLAIPASKPFGAAIAPPRPEKRPDKSRRGPRPSANGSPAFSSPREPAMTARGTIVPEIHVRRPPSPAKLWVATGLGAVGVAVMVIGGYWVLAGDSRPQQQPVASVAKAPAPEPPPTTVDPQSGFDITTEPPGAKVRLDGNEIGNAPLRVRSLLAGKHTLEVGGLAGHQPVTQEILVEQGKHPEINIKLDKAVAGAQPAPPTAPAAPATPTASSIIVKLTSEPPGARVALIVDGARTALGVTPTEAKVDPSRPSEVVFELDGHAPVTKPIAASDSTIAAVLVPVAAGAPPPAAVPVATPPPKEIAAPVAPRPRDPPPRRPPPRERERPRREPPPPREVATRTEPRPEPKETAPGPIETTPGSAPTPRDSGPKTVDVASGTGKLTLGAKPPCTIIVDGRDTGRTTPVRDLELPAGAVQITLVNSEYGIKESFTVRVKSGETTKVIKDFSDRLP